MTNVVIPLASAKKRITPRDVRQLERDVRNYIDRVAGREDPTLRREVRRAMQKGYMQLGSVNSKDRHKDMDATEEEG